MNTPNKMIWIGGMKEMGEASEAEHLKVIDLIAAHDWADVVLVGPEFAAWKDAFKWFETSADAAGYLSQHLPHDATILIKGSRGSKMENTLNVLG
jgi:UDP-N-acetylmuramoyl-tripeptide--D-alanyl-D-alanine ligase